MDREHHCCTSNLFIIPPHNYIIGNITDVYAVGITPKVLDNNLVGEWKYTPIINTAPKYHYTVLFQRNTTTLNVHDLENDLSGLTFTVKLQYEFKGPFKEKFTGISSAQITQNSVQAAISGAIFVGELLQQQ